MNKGTVPFRSLSLIGIVIAFLVAGPGLAQGSVSVGHASAVEAVQTIGPNHSTATPTYRSVVKPLSGWGMEPPPDNMVYNATFWGHNGSGTQNCMISGEDQIAKHIIYNYYCRQMTQYQADQWIY